MVPVNTLLNRIQGWNNEDVSTLKKEVGSRVTNLLVTTPTEVAAIAQNILLTSVYAAGSILKLGAKVVSYISGSEAVKKIEEKLPGFSQVLRAITRVVAYTIGTALTATFGVLSPKANFQAHCALGLAFDKRREEVQAAFKEQIAEQQEEITEEQHSLEFEDAASVASLPKEEASEAVQDEATVFAEEEILDVAEAAQDEATVAADESVEDSEIAETEVVQHEAAVVITEEADCTVNAELAEVENQPEVEYEIDSIEEIALPTPLSIAIDTAVGIVAHPMQAATNAFKYVSGFFGTQKA